MINNTYKLVLGLEIHFHLKIENKMFCRCSADIWGKDPNTLVCPTCLGLPGALPVPNAEAIKMAQLFGLAVGSDLSLNSRFDRKHYFYPDLPKGYQISQYKQPFCVGGVIKLASGALVELERVHLEEDVAKSFHEGNKTLIDFNKSGVPLVEVVTKPCIKTADDAVEFCKTLHDLIRYLGIGDADMEKGQLRIEPNISLRTEEMEKRNELPKYKVEVKNINSFKFMKKAVLYEIERQTEVLNSGLTPVQENRGWNDIKSKTVPQRSKEEAHDYRYFPEPDIPPFVFERAYFDQLRASLPELPWQTRARLIAKYAITTQQADHLAEFSNRWLLEKFELIASKVENPNKALNYLINKPEYAALTVDDFIARFNTLETQKQTASKNTDIAEAIIKKVIAANPKATQDFKNGKVTVLEFLVGQVMRETKGSIDISYVRELLHKFLTVT